MSSFRATICLSDISKADTRIGIDGKEYVDIYVARKRKLSPFASSHYVIIDRPSNKYEPKFIGNAREITEVGDV